MITNFDLIISSCTSFIIGSIAGIFIHRILFRIFFSKTIRDFMGEAPNRDKRTFMKMFLEQYDQTRIKFMKKS